AGPLTSVTAEYFAGVLAGYVYKASMDKIYVAGTTNGVDSAGGVAGVLYWGELTNSFSSVNTSAVRNAGGLIAIAGYSRISNSISIGQAMPNSADSGGVIGESEYMSYQHLHWATDVSGAQGSAGVDESETYFGAILTELQCPTTPDDRSCREGDVLYQNWASSVWNFGTTEQLPGLIIRGSVYRDGDGDGALDPNATPSVLIKMYQDGNEESTIVEGMGDVTIEAFITDPDEHDTFTLYWSIDGITEYTELGNSITFSSNGLPAGDYSITVVVTDSGVPSQSDSASTTVRVISDIAPISEDQTDSSPETNDTLPSDNSTDDGGRSGGGSIAWLLLLLIATIICHRQSYFVSKT
ncbi:MAG: autotransporter subunit C, partial [Thalassolituus sp.]